MGIFLEHITVNGKVFPENPKHHRMCQSEGTPDIV